MTFAQAQLDAEKRGEARGEARGITIGVVKTIVDLVRDGLLSIQEACKRTNLTEKEFRALLASNKS